MTTLKSSETFLAGDTSGLVELLEKLQIFNAEDTSPHKKNVAPGKFRADVVSGDISLENDDIMTAVLNQSESLENALFSCVEHGAENGIPEHLIPQLHEIVFYIHTIFGEVPAKKIRQMYALFGRDEYLW
ncbi:hypothetical protein [Puniceibacterium sediminis]|uniref:Uncharacterized protein n=1 Tax=Puniceibacterium sediminis TaxID=1608407 RepID=A0A238VNH8_9RHOB|nr:hypothetical protein [Puniceibacterium sediminis]SNR35039.1 hypothetical protein SAMN06265370_102339 [Puniceibacterium sediminis]